jgi:pilus assembly protein CpaE
VDVPRYATPFNRVFLDAAHQRVLVMDGSLASIRDALRFLALPPTPAQSRPPVLVLNHVGHPGMLSRKQVIEALSQAPEVTIPHLPKTLGRAATIGQPAARGQNAAHCRKPSRASRRRSPCQPAPNGQWRDAA